MQVLRLVCVVGLYWSACELIEYLVVRRHAAQTFPPKLGWRLLRWSMIAWCIAGIVERLHQNSRQPDEWPVWAFVLLLLFWVVWPRTVLVDSLAVSSCSLLGIRRRQIVWGQVSRITSDWEEQRLSINLVTAIWTFMGTSVTVTSRDGVSIQHGVLNRKQAVFLDALRRYLPRETFDVGLYDWRP